MYLQLLVVEPVATGRMKLVYGDPVEIIGMGAEN
jgi:hypothetical protein